MSTTHYCDTIIIGSGLAGIAAARTIEERNKHAAGREPITYEVLEADSKIGGRVQSEVIPVPGKQYAIFTSGAHRAGLQEPGAAPGRKGIVINTGAQWFHKDMRPKTPENPLLAEARQYDDLLPDRMPRKFYVHTNAARFSRNLQRTKNARALIDGYNEPKDVDLDSLFKTHGFGDWSALSTTFGEVETGAPLTHVSTEDVKNLVACNMGDFSLGGLSKFVKQYARDVTPRIHLGTEATVVRWKLEGREGVDVITKDGDIWHANKCIPAVSVGVLNARPEKIRFEPAMPPEYLENLSHVNMGNFNKVFLIFDSKFRFPVNYNTHLDVRTRDGHDIFFLAHDNGQPLVTAFFGGEEARLCDRDPENGKELAIRGLCEIWGEKIRDHIIATRVTEWGNNPHVLGGYSRVDIGHHHAREDLAKPIDNTIFLAGEALGAKHPDSGRNWATHMAGAALSGERAADLVIKSLERERGEASFHNYRRMGGQDKSMGIASIG